MVLLLSKQVRSNFKNKLHAVKNKVRNLIISPTGALIVATNGATVLQEKDKLVSKQNQKQPLVDQYIYLSLLF